MLCMENGDGPLKGFRNGDRMYKMEIKRNTNLGTYHVIDGQRVTARYPGQQQTCARGLVHSRPVQVRAWRGDVIRRVGRK